MSFVRSHSQWPEGIPTFIRRHEERIEPENYGAATHAWRYFVRERWVVGGMADQQKRNLIEQWATADQEFRDNYQSRAPEHEPSLFESFKFTDPSVYKSDAKPFCDIYICITQLNEEKEALLAKCILALFAWDSGWEFLVDQIVMFFPLRDSQGDLLDTFQLQKSVARPNFDDMGMTLDGTVLFRYGVASLIIDDRTLETGLGLWAKFGTNGIYEKAYRVQMLWDNFAHLCREIGPGNQTPLELAMYHMDCYPRYADMGEDWDPKIILEDDPVDMRKPFVDIYQDSDIEVVEQIDNYAPGFREAEEKGNGLAIGYDLRRILVSEGNSLTITDHERPHMRSSSIDDLGGL